MLLNLHLLVFNTLFTLYIIYNFCFRLYVNGWTMSLEKLYPPINYPVSRGTDKISPLLRWDHSVSLFVSKFELNKTSESGERKFTINMASDERSYVDGHRIDGIIHDYLIIQFKR